MANKCVCGWNSAPDPAEEAYSAPPDPLAGLRGPTSKGKGRRGRRRSVSPVWGRYKALLDLDRRRSLRPLAVIRGGGGSEGEGNG